MLQLFSFLDVSSVKRLGVCICFIFGLMKKPPNLVEDVEKNQAVCIQPPSPRRYTEKELKYQ